MDFIKRQIIDSVYLEITNECNLRCAHCYNRSGLSDSKFIELRKIKDLIQRNAEEKIQSITLSGGEPLLHPEICEIIEYLLQNNIAVFLITNGQIPIKKLSNYLIADNPIQLQISLDGATAETNDKIRGNGSFEKAMKSIQYLHESGYKAGAIRMTVNPINQREIEQFFNLCLNYSFLPSLALTNKIGSAEVNWEKLGYQEFDKVSVHQKIRSIYQENDFILKSMFDNYEYNKHGNMATIVCPLFLNEEPLSLLVKVDGSVHPCQKLYDREFCIGNAFSDKFTDIINDSHFKSVCTLFETREQNLKESRCTKCYVSQYCRGGCPAVALQEGDLMSLDGYCLPRKSDFFHSNLDSILVLS